MTSHTHLHPITDIQLRNWVRAGDPVAKSDGGGLTFTLSAAGTAAWILRYRAHGKRKEITLGNYPDLTLTNARKLASAMRVDVAMGKDPGLDRQEAKRAAMLEKNVDWLIEDYKAMVLPRLAKGTIQMYSRQLKRIGQQFGKRPAASVEGADIVMLLRRYQANGWREAESLWIVCKELFKHARGQQLTKTHPCSDIELQAVIGKRPTPKKRLMLTESELHCIINAEMSPPNLLAVRLLLGTMVRTNELVNAKWSDVHMDDATLSSLGCGRWHIPKSKTGTAFDIPLSPLLIGWFTDLKELAWDSAYILPARTYSRLSREGGDAPINHNTIRDAIDWWLTQKSPQIRRFTPHDLRSTGRSYLRSLGIERDIAEMCLNHKLPGVEGIYDQYSYWTERYAAIQAWSTRLEALQAIHPSNSRSSRTIRRLGGRQLNPS